ncbi:PTS lactose/cellobiose transporter subunit IIA [Clostridium tagluense]|uniref:PTS lactose/cellobiose transporter subunit IIA n=1 Tax=Clostridium tagluense TaxID=360422 RepID=UPI001C0B8FA3|nr:PTS lactose/cellobiose transporter subunit IIA [Clostridium tagluense]MBU3128889.1 PTS lactose/cellobiose transporter subunit IIA [Clostridium tagluense]MCB2310338.1 PTS lactose/cellobiose transporter subunit IIA [Clostridium tagluense]MCB2315020.1 PTS lactose/cellobiose transporter subunit IIA [Clostridium tagluense]MCB2320038.1 PTS lactose/cellobiose transporter subunit IIA [Clostridium tagluense]MCB2324763.1 PTS lactose/cellobiose transporter subunit IIA [Clostridium tagluense]
MDNVDNQEVIMQLIVLGGNARSISMQAIVEAKNGNILKAKETLKEASVELNNAHKIQTQLIQKEISGQGVEISLLMIHAQDHLMNAITVKDLATEFIDLYEKIAD